MTPSMNTEELAALLPLAQHIPVTVAAQILGGGKATVQNLIERVTSGEIFSWSHSSPHTAPSVVTYPKIGLVQELPAVTPDTDPATVLIPSGDVVWCWCRDIEQLLIPTGDTTTLEARISARLQALQSRAYELKTGSAPTNSTPAPSQVVPEVNIVGNSTTPDPERRLARLRALGGDVIYKRGEWKITGISALVASEKGEGRKRCDEKTIRADLKEAAENENEAKRAGFGSGLGQR